MADGRLFFRVMECADGAWACRRGRDECDRHHTYEAALDHITTIALQHRPAEIYVHYLDGRVQSTVVLGA